MALGKAQESKGSMKKYVKYTAVKSKTQNSIGVEVTSRLYLMLEPVFIYIITII